MYYTDQVFFVTVAHTKASTTWFLQDEFSSQLETSKKDTSPEHLDPVGKLERTGSMSKKKVQPKGTFEYTVSL